MSRKIGAKKRRDNDELQLDLIGFNEHGNIDPRQLKSDFTSLGFEVRNPTINQVVSEMDTPETTEQGGVEPNEFNNRFTAALTDLESKEGAKKIFEIFVDDPKKNVITMDSLIRILGELGENRSEDELMEIVKKISRNGKDISFQDFYDFMSKKI